MTHTQHYSFTLKRITTKKTLASGNEMISSNDRMFHHVRAAITQHLRQLASTEKPTHQFNADNPCRVIVTVYSPTKRRMDAPNWYPTVKALLDGLTDAGQWTDDNNDVIKETAFRYGGLSDIKSCYRFDIKIEPYDEAG